MNMGPMGLLGAYQPSTGQPEFPLPPSEQGPPSPVGGEEKGRMPWGRIAATVAGAPLIGLLANKLSGGSVSFGDALGHMGQGFADEKYKQMKQRRQQEFEQDNTTIDLAHKEVQNLSKIPANVMQKFPRLQELAAKYQQALAKESEGGSRVTPKEAGEIVQLVAIARHDMTAAQGEADKQKGVDAELNKQGAQQAAYKNLFGQAQAGGFGPGGEEYPGPPQGEGPTPEQRFAAGELRQRSAQAPREVPGLGLVTPNIAATQAREDSRTKRAELANQLRERLANTRNSQTWGRMLSRQQWQEHQRFVDARAKYIADNVADPAAPTDAEIASFGAAFDKMHPHPSGPAPTKPAAAGGAAKPAERMVRYQGKVVPLSSLPPELQKLVPK